MDPKPRLHKEFAWAEGVGYLSTSPPDENLFTVLWKGWDGYTIALFLKFMREIRVESKGEV